MMNSSRNANVISSAPVAPGSFSVSGHDLILDFISPSIASTSTSTSTSSHHNQRRRSSILIPGGNNTNINTTTVHLRTNYDSTVMNTDSNTYNSSHDDDNDGVIEIRFSDMPYETEAVINGLILFEEKEIEKKKKEKMATSPSSEEDGRATTITATPNAITLTTTTTAAAAANKLTERLYSSKASDLGDT